VKTDIPEVVVQTANTLTVAGFEAFLVGGCVRDLLLNKKPRDWDITTNANPEQIQALFPHSFYENTYGTVGIVNDGVSDETLKTIEITPYRIDGTYLDKRHPQSVIFARTIEEDLARRDFTMNAIALDYKGQLKDPYKGQKDIKDGLIRAVGNAEERFNEDALRMLRAVRLSAELDFAIEETTKKAIVENAKLLAEISRERIRDEFTKIIMSDHPKRGLEVAHEVGLLKYISPDLEAGIGMEQGGIHAYDVWEHTLRTVDHAAKKSWSLEVRLAALLHDIGKPPTRKKGPLKWTFYGHDVVGARIAEHILSNLKFPKKTIEKVSKLVRWHMFFSDTETITPSAVRRLISNVGKENIWDLMDVRVADRVGTGRPKESPYRLRKYHAMIDEVMRDPISVGMLAIDGSNIMKAAGEKAGPRIGFILHALLEEVLENPKINTLEYLEKRASDMAKMTDLELKQLGEKGKQAEAAEEQKEISKIRKQHFVE
jgi:putative nucleotidyltransferase with HDIG domain